MPDGSVREPFRFCEGDIVAVETTEETMNEFYRPVKRARWRLAIVMTASPDGGAALAVRFRDGPSCKLAEIAGESRAYSLWPHQTEARRLLEIAGNIEWQSSAALSDAIRPADPAAVLNYYASHSAPRRRRPRRGDGLSRC